VLARVEDDRGEQRDGEESVAPLTNDADREELAEIIAAERDARAFQGAR
jgi:hypothetical protein